jgi:hypothetical protein
MQMLTVVRPKNRLSGFVRVQDSGKAQKRYAWQGPLEKAGVPASRDPRKFPWGFYSQEDGTFVGGFLWFRSIHEMLTYMALAEPRIYLHEDDEDEIREMQSRLLVQRDRLMAQKRIQFASVQKTFEGELGDYATVSWIGHFNDLRAGKQGFPADVLSDFLDVAEGEVAVRTLPKARVTEFIEFLQSYGA